MESLLRSVENQKRVRHAMLGVRVEDAVAAQFEQICKDLGITVSEGLRQLVSKVIEQYNNK